MKVKDWNISYWLNTKKKGRILKIPTRPNGAKMKENNISIKKAFATSLKIETFFEEWGRLGMWKESEIVG